MAPLARRPPRGRRLWVDSPDSSGLCIHESLSVPRCSEVVQDYGSSNSSLWDV